MAILAGAMTMAVFVVADRRFRADRQQARDERLKGRLAEESLHTILNSLPFPFMIVTKDKHIRHVNAAAVELMGYQSPDELLGRVCHGVVCPAERNACPILDLSQQVDKSERTLLAKGGKRIPILKSVVPVRLDDEDVLLELFLDISEQKRYEGELRRAKDAAEAAVTRLRTLSRAVEQNPASVAITDTAGTIAYVNPGFVATTGYSLQEATGKNPRVLKSGVHPPEFYTQMWQTLARGEVWRGKICNRNRSGELYWEDATIAPVLDTDGRTTHFVAVKIDITARKQAETKVADVVHQIQRTTAFQQAILNSAEYAIIATEVNGTMTAFNTGAERMLGYRAEEVVGKIAPDVIHDRDEVIERSRELSAELGFAVAANFETFVAKARLGQSDEHEWTFIRKDGTRFPVMLSVTSIRDPSGQVTGFLGIAQDITARKEAEHALRASEERHRLLAENMRDVVWATDLAEKTTYVSPSIELLNGYTPAEWAKKSIEEKFTPESVARMRKRFAEVRHQAATDAASLAQCISIEAEYLCKNGGTVWTEMNMTWILGKKGIPVGVMGVTRNISVRKKADQEFQENARKLERANRELEKANAAIQAANQAKSAFLATMSHELRTPLNGVIGMTELLRHTELDERQRQFVEACHSSGRSLLDLINDILDFSKIEAGKMELEQRDFDVELLVQEVAGPMGLLARQKGLQFATRIAPQVRRGVRGDSARLRQVLINLIGNAIKFTEAGEVAVSVGPAELHPGEATLRFEVSDTGIGIPPDRIERLFQSFSQADSSTTRKYGGTGLGLAICKRLVELLHGQIGVRSAAGHGSTFWFEVPLRPAPTARAPQQDRAEASDTNRPTRGDLLQGRRVLLVEDNRVNQMFAGEILRRAGIACRTAENGRQALEAVESEPFDLVLMDCQMPEMDGFEAMRRLRAMERDGRLAGHLPVIALTASAVQGDRQRCLDAGMDSYISKPFDAESLLDAMGRLLAAQEKEPAAEPPAEPQPMPSPACSTPPIDRDALARRCMGDLEFAAELLSEFENMLADRVERIARPVREGNAAAAGVAAHGLKGEAGTMAAESLRALAAAIESAGKANELSKVAALVDQLGDEVQRCRQYIPELRRQLAAP